MYDIVVIGGGPAGLTAAIYARRANKNVLVLEAQAFGGQIISTLKIDNYPGLYNVSGTDFANNLEEQAKALGATLKYEKAIEINTKEMEVVTVKNVYKTKAIILALGVKPRKLDLPNEEELIGKGISYCATCDGNFFKNKVVAVNGGGNAALEDALYLTDIAKKVYLIHRRDTFRAEDKTISMLKKKDNITFVLNSNITSINGKDHLESVEVTDNEGNKNVIEVDGLFEAIGQIPENSNIIDELELDQFGYIITDENMHTNLPHIYAAGDIRQKTLRQLTTATADGSIAATEAIKDIANN
jgi:thioredoxin reductase (NADPH)